MSGARDTNEPSHVEFRQLVEVTVVVRHIELAERCAREDEQVLQGESQARRPRTIRNFALLSVERRPV